MTQCPDPYLVVTVRLTLDELATAFPSPPTATSMLQWLATHGIDVTRPFSWTDPPGERCRVFRQQYPRPERRTP